MIDEYLTPSQVAKELGCTRQTVVSWVKKGLLRAIQIGPKKHTRIIKSSFQDYKSASEVKSDSVVEGTTKM
jgi:excisionase family DNA binding protein